MLSQRPLSDKPLSTIVTNVTASLALAPAISVFALTAAEAFSASLALAPAIPVFSLTGSWLFLSASLALIQAVSAIHITDAEQFIVASMFLTQPGSSTIVIDGNHNSLTMWQAAVSNNNRIRQNDPSLKQLRKVQPRLGE